MNTIGMVLVARCSASQIRGGGGQQHVGFEQPHEIGRIGLA